MLNHSSEGSAIKMESPEKKEKKTLMEVGGDVSNGLLSVETKLRETG